MERQIYADREAAMNKLWRNGITIDDQKKKISLDKKLVGIKLWGAIDFLVNYHKFTVTT